MTTCPVCGAPAKDSCIHVNRLLDAIDHDLVTADLTPAQAARLEDVEAAPYAEEAAVERVARAIAAERDGLILDADDWDYIFREDEREDFRRLAVAAIDVMRGATDDGAVGRVLALCDSAERDGTPVTRTGSTWVVTRSMVKIADLRAAVGAPATAEGDEPQEPPAMADQLRELIAENRRLRAALDPR